MIGARVGTGVGAGDEAVVGTCIGAGVGAGTFPEERAISS